MNATLVEKVEALHDILVPLHEILEHHEPGLRILAIRRMVAGPKRYAGEDLTRAKLLEHALNEVADIPDYMAIDRAIPGDHAWDLEDAWEVARHCRAIWAILKRARV